MPASLSPAFEQAVKDSKLFASPLPQGDLLELYALFKQSRADPVFADAPAPGMFALKDKAKYNAWKEKKDLTPEQAQEAYVKKMEGLKQEPEYKWSADNAPVKVGNE